MNLFYLSTNCHLHIDMWHDIACIPFIWLTGNREDCIFVQGWAIRGPSTYFTPDAEHLLQIPVLQQAWGENENRLMRANSKAWPNLLATLSLCLFIREGFWLTTIPRKLDFGFEKWHFLETTSLLAPCKFTIGAGILSTFQIYQLMWISIIWTLIWNLYL